MRPFRQILKYTNQPFPKHIYRNSLNEFKPCKEYCLCLIYLNMNDLKDRNYYNQCYRTQLKNQLYSNK